MTVSSVTCCSSGFSEMQLKKAAVGGELKLCFNPEWLLKGIPIQASRTSSSEEEPEAVFSVIHCSFNRDIRGEDLVELESSTRQRIEAEWQKEIGQWRSDFYKGWQPTGIEPPQKDIDQFNAECKKVTPRGLFKYFCKHIVKTHQLSYSHDKTGRPSKVFIEEIVRDLLIRDSSPDCVISSLRKLQSVFPLLEESEVKAVFDFKKNLNVRRLAVTHLSTFIREELQSRSLEMQVSSSSLENEISEELGNQMKAMFVGYTSSEQNFITGTYMKNLVHDVNRIFNGFKEKCKSQGDWSHSLTSDYEGRGDQKNQWIEASTDSLMKQLERFLSEGVQLPFVVSAKIESAEALQCRSKEELEPCEAEVRRILKEKAEDFREEVKAYFIPKLPQKSAKGRGQSAENQRPQMTLY